MENVIALTTENGSDQWTTLKWLFEKAPNIIKSMRRWSLESFRNENAGGSSVYLIWSDRLSISQDQAMEWLVVRPNGDLFSCRR